MFITFGISSRRHVFGEVNGSKVAYSPAGLAALETFQLERMRNPDLTVHSFVIMPDHVHLRIHVRPGASEPLKAVGKFVNNFKRWTKWKAAKLGVAIDWQANYHDRLCLNAEVIDLVDKYIANNPLKYEALLPNHVGILVKEGKCKVKVLTSNDSWFGVTYKEDKPTVVAKIQSLKDDGTYPDNLF